VTHAANPMKRATIVNGELFVAAAPEGGGLFHPGATLPSTASLALTQLILAVVMYSGDVVKSCVSGGRWVQTTMKGHARLPVKL